MSDKPAPTHYAETLVKCLCEFDRYIGWKWQLEAKMSNPISHAWFYLDIYEPRSKLAIELNGGHHYTNPLQGQRDRLKQDCATLVGVEIIWMPNNLLDFQDEFEPLDNDYSFVQKIITRYYQQLGATVLESYDKMEQVWKQRSDVLDSLAKMYAERGVPREYLENVD
jgi:hypothetical protein